jgi:hypothetical protein
MVCLGVESEYYSNLLRELRGLTLWDKIWKSWIKYNLFLKKVEYYSEYYLTQTHH